MLYVHMKGQQLNDTYVRVYDYGQSYDESSKSFNKVWKLFDKALPSPLPPHRLLFVGLRLIQIASIMRSVLVPPSAYSYFQLYVLQGSQVNMLRHVIADPKDTFSVTGGSEVSNYGTVNHAAPLDTAQDRTSLSAVLHVTLRHQKADQVQITCSTILWSCCSLKQQQ